jgi:hypothetical protein
MGHPSINPKYQSLLELNHSVGSSTRPNAACLQKRGVGIPDCQVEITIMATFVEMLFDKVFKIVFKVLRGRECGRQDSEQCPTAFHLLRIWIFGDLQLLICIVP